MINNFWIMQTYFGQSESEEWSSVKRLAELTEMLGGHLFDEVYKSWSYDVTSALIYLAAVEK